MEKRLSVSGSKRFWLADGRVLKSLKDLEVALRDIEEDVFRKHRGFFRNDFSNWIGVALGDKKLARSLRFLRNKEKFAEKIRKRLRDFGDSELEIRFSKENFLKNRKINFKILKKKLLTKSDKRKLKRIVEKDEKSEALKYLLFSKLDIMCHEIKKEANNLEEEMAKFIMWDLERLEKKMNFIKMGYEEDFYSVFERLNLLKKEVKNV